MSISNDLQLAQANEQLLRLYRGITALRVDLAESNPLAFKVMAEGPLSDIRALREAITAYTGEAELESEEVDFRFRLKGTSIQWRDTPIGVLAAYFKSLRVGLRSLVEFHIGRLPANAPSIELKQISDLSLVDLRPGSLDVGLRVPEVWSSQRDIFEPRSSSPLKEALSDFLKTSDWASRSADDSELQELFPKPSHRRRALNSIRTFVPRRRGGLVEEISLYGKAVTISDRIILTRSAGQHIADAYKNSLSENEVSCEGVIREIDLDNQSFELRQVVDKEKAPCTYPESLEGIAKKLLGRRVIVVGIQQKIEDEPVGKLAVSEITRAGQ